jgi:uncharacterized protein YukE
MPVQTYIAGSPAGLSSLAGSLDGAFARACENLVDDINDVRRDIEYHWTGDAGEAARSTSVGLRAAAEDLRSTSTKIGSAIQAFANSLERVQSAMEDARSVALTGGLVVTERLIEGPPPPADESWRQPWVTVSSPAEEAALQDWVAKDAAYAEADRIAGDAVDDLADACQRLIDDLGDEQSGLTEVGKSLQDMFGGALSLPGERVLPGLERRMLAAATSAGFFASISPEQSRLLYENLFLQMDELDDAALIRKLTVMSDYGGKGVDGLMIGLSAIERHEQGQSTNQILLAEGGGWVTGALATGGTWAAGGAIFGAPATPVGSIVLGGVALVVGTGVGIFTSNQVDDWYEDQEFEEMIRNGELDQERRPAS